MFSLSIGKGYAKDQVKSSKIANSWYIVHSQTTLTGAVGTFRISNVCSIFALVRITALLVSFLASTLHNRSLDKFACSFTVTRVSSCAVADGTY